MFGTGEVFGESDFGFGCIFIKDLDQGDTFGLFETGLRSYSTDKQRKYVRFEHNKGNLLQLQIVQGQGQISHLNGLIMDESFGGICLLLTTELMLHVKQLCYLQIPDIGKVKARVSWLRPLSFNQMTVGLQYIQL